MRRVLLAALAVLGLTALGWALLGGSGGEPASLERKPSPGLAGATPDSAPSAPDAGQGAAVRRAALRITVIEPETGAPLAGARVIRLGSDAMIAWADNVKAEWTADAHGRLEIALEVTGALLVTATAPGHIWAPSQTVKLDAEGVAEVTLQPPRGIAVEGTVVDPKGAPLPEIHVEGVNQRYADAADSERRPGDSWSALETDAHGAFRLFLRRGGATLTAGSGTWRVEELAVEIPAGRQTIVLHPAGALRGTVFDSRGDPVGSGVTVTFSSSADTTTDEKGRFSFDAIEVDEGELECVLNRPSGAEVARVHVSTAPGRWSEQDLHLEPAAAILGAVVDTAGRPVADAGVVAIEVAEPVEGEGPVDLHGTTPEVTFEDRYRAPEDRVRTTSGADGRFTLPTRHLAGEGWYVVHAFSRSATDDSGAGATPVHAGAAVTLKLAEEPTVRGRVTSPDGRLAKFTIYGADFHDAFELARETVGNQLRIEAAGYRFHQVDLSNQPPGSVDLGTITLHPTHDVVLEAVDAETGKPVANLVSDLDGSPDVISSVDARGRPLLVGVPLPTARVWVGNRFYLPVALDIGPTTELITVRLSHGGSVHFTASEPLADGLARVTCDPPLPLLTVRGAPFVNGQATVAGFPAAHCTWVVEADRGTGRGVVDVRPGGTVEAVVQLSPWPPRDPNAPAPHGMPLLRGRH